MNGRAMLLAEAPSPLVDRDCRVLDINGLPIPRLLGIGLAAGFIPSGASAVSPAFADRPTVFGFGKTASAHDLRRLARWED